MGLTVLSICRGDWTSTGSARYMYGAKGLVVLSICMRKGTSGQGTIGPQYMYAEKGLAVLAVCMLRRD